MRTRCEYLYNNQYLSKLHEVVNSYRGLCRDRKDLREAIIEEHGTDSDEYKQWCKDELKFKCSVSNGEFVVADCWSHAIEYDLGYLVVRDHFVDKKQIVEFLSALKNAGIREFVVTNTNSGLLSDIKNLIDLGCTLVSGIVVRYDPTLERPAMYVRGLKFKISSLDYRYAVFDECDKQCSEILDTYEEASDFCKELRDSYPHSDYSVKRILMSDWEEC